MEDATKKIVSCSVCGSWPVDFFLRKNACDLYRCSRCDHLFIYPVPPAIENIYDDEYFSGGQKGAGYVNYDVDKEPMRPVFVEYLRRVDKILPGKGKLLDVGAATGFFVGIANSLGWQGTGLEISDYAARMGREKGLDIRTGVLVNAHLSDESYDIVTMWDVLEHFPNPGDDVAEANRILKPLGVLAINTPNSASLYAKLLGSRWHLLVPPEHINYFSPESITVLLNSHQFEVIKISTLGKTFTVPYIIHMLGTWFKSKMLLHLAVRLKTWPLVSTLGIPINLHDNMLVYARKK